MMSLARKIREAFLMLGLALFLTVWTTLAQAAPFIYYPTDNPAAVGTSMAGKPTTFDASATPGSSYVWKFKGCSGATCPSGKVVTYTYADPGRTFVMLTVDGKTFPNVAVQVQQATFTVTVTPSEGGRVTAGAGTGAGIACGSGETRCQDAYLDDIGVLLHATPEPEWRTSHWIVNGRTVMTDQPLLLKGNEPYAAQAIFTPKQLSISSTPPPLRGAFYEYEIATSGGRGQPTFTLLNGPSGMTIDGEGVDEGTSTEGVLEWQATPEQTGTHEVIVQAQDADGLTAQQTFTLAVGAETFDTVEPVITLEAAPDVIMLGQSVTITSAATDNMGVLDFALILNDQTVATSPGRFTYTPPAAGRYRVVAVAQDGGGNTDLKRISFWVKDATATIKLYEGFDAEHGVSETDDTLMTFTSAPLTDTTTIPLPPGVTRLVTFSPAADWHFEAANGLKLLLEPGVTGALLPNTAYGSVTAAIAGTYRVMVTGWQAVGGYSQYVSRTKEFTVSAAPFTVIITPNAKWTVRGTMGQGDGIICEVGAKESLCEETYAPGQHLHLKVMLNGGEDMLGWKVNDQVMTDEQYLNMLTPE